jgi:hypothetical protein
LSLIAPKGNTEVTKGAKTGAFSVAELGELVELIRVLILYLDVASDTIELAQVRTV